MPYEITYVEDEGGVIATYWGTVTDSDIIQSIQERCESNEKLKSYCYSISDFSQVSEFLVTPDGLKANANLAIRASESNKRLIVTVVAPTDLQYGSCRMWEVYAAQTNWKTRTVRSLVEAQEWIKNTMKQGEL
jgi:hypothetical protein